MLKIVKFTDVCMTGGMHFTAFRDPEDGFWEKNSSEGIVGNSEVY